MTYRPWIGPALLVIVSAILHFGWLTQPNEVVFDEVHFGKFVSAYCCTHERFFDIHPPHAKLLIAAAVSLTNYAGKFPFDHIGETFTPDVPVFAFRVVPALAGTLLPLIIYILLRQVNVSRLGALLGGAAVVFDNATMLQTKLIALDGILLVSQFGALACFLHARAHHKSRFMYLWMVAAGVLCGLAVGTKFTGLMAVALILFIMAVDLWQTHVREWRRTLLSAVIILICAFVVYLGGWAIHYSILTLPGSGDMWQLPSGNLLSDVLDIQKKMLSANYNLTATHPYSSPWWTWPIMARPVFYWQESRAYLYFLGNPVVWWGSGIGLVLVVLPILWQAIHAHWKKLQESETWIFLAGYGIAILPLVRVPRALFLYHYLTPIMFCILLSAIYLDGMWRRLSAKDHQRRVAAVLLLMVAGFILFTPLTFGFPISEGWHTALYWFPRWR